jgi:mannosyltransferase
VLVLGAIVVAGAALRLATLDQTLWFDEHFAATTIASPFGELLPRILQIEGTPPLFFFITAGWERVVGDSDTALRLLSVLFGLATIPVVFEAARTLAGQRAGIAAAALTATNPFVVWYSIEVRAYALAALLTAVSFLCCAKLLTGEDRRWLWGWAISSAVAIATHYFAAFLVGVEAIILLVALRRARVDIALACGAIGAVGVALVPVYAAQPRFATAYLELIPFGERLWQVPQHLVVGLSVPWAPLAPLLTVAAALVLLWAGSRLDGRERRAVLIAGGLAAAVLAVVLIIAAVGGDYLNTRNLIVLWAPFAVAVGALLTARGAGRFGVACCATIAALGVALSLWSAFDRYAARPDWSEVATAIGPAAEGRVILGEGLAAPVNRYLSGGGRSAELGEVVATREIAVLEPRDVPDRTVGPCWWGAICRGEDAFLEPQLPYDVPGEFRAADTSLTDFYVVRRYVADREVQLPPAPFGGVQLQGPEAG